MLSNRDLCGGPITRPEESYRLWCVTVCDVETSRIRRPWPALGCYAKEEEGVTVNVSSSLLGDVTGARTSARDVLSSDTAYASKVSSFRPSFQIFFSFIYID